MPLTSSPRGARRADRTAHQPLKPFTVDHFRAYTKLLVLDSGDFWDIQGFQAEFAEDLFARTEDGRALYPEEWLIVPEGNGKSTMLGGTALYHADFTPTAEVLMAAASRDQCGILFGQAAGFVYRSPGFDKRFRVFEGYRRIKALRTEGRIQVHAADDRTGDGVIPTLCLVDELHRHKDLALYRTWAGKLPKRGGQLVTISTAGEPGTEFEETRERLRQTATDLHREGRHTRAVSGEVVLHDHALDPDDDASDLALVKLANPFSGVTPDTLARKKARPTMTEAHWRRFVCNLATRSEESAISEREWSLALCDGDVPVGVPVDVGLDLGWKWDTTALVPLWEPRGEPRVLGQAKIIVPPRDGSSTRPETVQQAFLDLHAINPIRRVVLDPSAGAEQLVSWLESEIGCEVVEYAQTAEPMALAYARFVEGLREGRLLHSGDPELTKHVLNAVARMLPTGKSRFDRPSGARNSPGGARRVIDGLIAAAMVHSVAAAESTQTKSDRAVYFL